MFLKVLIIILEIFFHVDLRIQSACFNITHVIFFYLYALKKIFSSGCEIYRNEMECARRYSSYFIYGWTSTCIYGALHWCTNPLLLGTWTLKQMNSTNHTFIRTLPFIAWYPFNTDNIYNYICLYLMQIIGGVSSALGIICYDCFYVTMLMIICAQFQYINTILRRIDFDKYDQSLFYCECFIK